MQKSAIFKSFASLILAAAAAPALGATITANYLYNPTVNHAPSGVASQSNTGYGGVPSRANDGVVTQGFSNNSTTHTDDTIPGNNHWQVDLLATKPVNEIRITNRGEGLNARLSNYRVQVLDSSNAEVWGQSFFTTSGNAGDLEIVSLPAGISGQTVRVQQLGLNAQGNNVLSLTEVEVLDLPERVNHALTGSASQSSTGYGGVASRINDNNTNGQFGGNSVSHTDDAQPLGAPVWLKLDLAEDIQINEIALFNRADCCANRLANFKLSVRRDGSEVWSRDFLNGDPIAGGGIISVHDDLGGFFVTGDEVRIDLINGLDGSGANNIHLAELQVFGSVVPEPSATIALAGLALLGRRRRTA